MRNILGVVGSPRKGGNTHVLVERILEGAASKGAEVKTLLLGDLDIKECNGCHVCWSGKDCSKRDDMNGIFPLLASSDVIVFGTPVYWYGPTALMKAFIDRFVYFNCPENRSKIRGKGAVIVSPFEEDNLETAAGLEMFFEKSFGYLEMPVLGKFLVPGVTLRGEVREKAERMAEAFELGVRLGA